MTPYSEVSSTEALVLLQSLCCLLQEGNFRESVPLNHHSKKRLRIHKSEQLPSKSAAVGWIAALLEAHFIGLRFVTTTLTLEVVDLLLNPVISQSLQQIEWDNSGEIAL